LQGASTHGESAERHSQSDTDGQSEGYSKRIAKGNPWFRPAWSNKATFRQYCRHAVRCASA